MMSAYPARIARHASPTRPRAEFRCCAMPELVSFEPVFPPNRAGKYEDRNSDQSANSLSIYSIKPGGTLISDSVKKFSEIGFPARLFILKYFFGEALVSFSALASTASESTQTLCSKCI